MYTPELKKIARIQFGILSPDEIRKMAVAQIITPDTYLEDGTPVENGLMDRRLGTIEPGQRCATCGNQVGDCPGHFGVVELARPVLHVGYAKSIIYKLLRCSCRSCQKLLLPEEDVRAYEKRLASLENQAEGLVKRFYKDVAKEARKKTKCTYCGEEQYKIRYEKPTTFYQETPQGPVKLTPKNIYDWFSRISSRHLRMLGINTTFARPEWMVITDLPVPPVSVRASITLESGIKSEDDLTHKLVDIIRINKRLRENIEAGAPQLIVEDLWELLQYHVTTYMDNEVAGIPPARHRSGRALRTLTQRLRGKEGRFRGNLSGKRVDFSARTVISPDPNISINEVGVPEQIAKILTVPERVTEWNIEEMKELVMNGPAGHPGSNYIIRSDSKRIDLRFVGDLEKTAEMIEKGFTVERHLRDGDIVLFNRQPSLHRMSIMAHEVKVMAHKTFRLHLCVCTPYNADFDGDEMNLHIPQSEEARAEARTLMRVQEQIISPRYGGPIIGAIHDYITAAHLLTRKGTLIEKENAWQLLLSGNYEEELPPPAIAHPKELWTGKQIFSLMLPKDVNITSKSRTCKNCQKCTKEACEYDDYVVIRDGILHTGTIDRRAIGADQAESVLHVVVRDHGSDRAREFLDSLTQLLLKHLSHLGFSMGISNIILPDEGRRRIKRVVADSEKSVEKIIKSFKDGTLQSLPGKTPRESLEMKIMGELSKARDSAGSVARGYLGMSNTVVVMTTTGARGTPLSITQMSACVGQQSIRGQRILRGYRDRTLPHYAKGSISAESRGFVKSNFRDGLSPIEFFFHAQGGREGLVDTAVRTSTSGYLQRRLVNALQDLYVNHDGAVRTAEGEIVQFVYGEDGVDPVRSFHGKAIDVKSIIEDLSAGRLKEFRLQDEVNSKAINLLKPLVSKYEFPDSVEKEIYDVIGKIIGLKKALAIEIIESAYDSYLRSLAESGEAVGTVASQSIGEPGTQMTLKTFHFAGVAELNVTIGLPRLIEILDARKNPSSPVMKVYLSKEYAQDEKKAIEIQRKIELTTIEDISSAISIDMAEMRIVVDLDEEMMDDKGITIDNVVDNMTKLKKGEVSKENEFTVSLDPNETDIDELYRLHEKVQQLRVKGLKGIGKVIMVRDPEVEEWVLYAEGSNISEVITITGVDPARIDTNNIQEILETLGVEASRNSLIKESISVLEEQGLEVDIRHLILVADMMTQNGDLRQIGRHGISGEKESVLAKASFEVTVRHLLESAAYGKLDKLKGITENVIIGQIIPIGTGTVELIMMPGTPEMIQSVSKGEEDVYASEVAEQDDMW